MTVLPPADTWSSFVACIAFQATVSFFCLHERGADLAKRGPTILGRWLKRRQDAIDRGDGAAAPARIKPPMSVAQSWRLGALHERFFKGARSGGDSTLREAGDLLGIGRALTEEEFLSLARVSERTGHRAGGWCCNFADCMFVTGTIGVICTIGPALYYITTPIHPFLTKVMANLNDLVHATPTVLLCLVALIISLAFVCDGFRASDNTIGGRIALTGALGAMATMFSSTMLETWADGLDMLLTGDEEKPWMILLGYSAAVLAPIAVKFEFSLGGFLATASAYYFGYSAAGLLSTGYSSTRVCGPLLVDALFALAVCCGTKARNLQPFASGVMAMGVFLLHLELFFRSETFGAMFWSGRAPVLPHVLAQLPVFVCLASGWALGKRYGCEGLINNSRLFGFLYVATTVYSLSSHLPGKGGEALGLVLVFFSLWRVGLYLHGHRGFIASLWTLDTARISHEGRSGDVDGNENQPGAGDALLGEGPTFGAEMAPSRAPYVAPEHSSPRPIRYVKPSHEV